MAARWPAEGAPPQCATRMALVVGEILSSRSPRCMVNVRGSMSTHLKRRPLASAGQSEAGFALVGERSERRVIGGISLGIYQEGLGM